MCATFAARKHSLLLKNFVAIFLLLMFFCQSFNKVVVYAVFYANQHYIEQTLCVNRNKPWMHCNGHCQLNKKLATDDKQDAQHPAQRAANEMSVLFFHPVAGNSIVSEIKDHTPLNGHYISPASQTFINTSFHPPAIA